MDIMLERILSLIPHKPDGKFVHGALKDFANKLELKSGNIVADWIAGRSSSYKNYIYQIATIYDVSVEWLKGETDEPKKKKESPDVGELLEGLPQDLQQLIQICKAHPALIEPLLSLARQIGNDPVDQG